VRQYDGFRFDLQGLMLRQNIELVDPVAECIRDTTYRAMRDSVKQAERETTLRLVMHRPQPDFVITFRNRADRSEIPSRCKQMVSVHAITRKSLEVTSRNVFANSNRTFAACSFRYECRPRSKKFHESCRSAGAREPLPVSLSAFGSA